MITILIPRHTLTCFSILQTHQSFQPFSVHFFGEKNSLPGPFVTWPLWCFALCRDCCLALRSLVPSLRLSRRQREAPNGVGRGKLHGRRWKGWGDGRGKLLMGLLCHDCPRSLKFHLDVSRNNQMGPQESIRALAVAVALALCHTGRSWLGGH